ncbi:hypothetical protein E2C01_050264 [Portunus trituberculatus]|uniref:Uncharacterized protein n=1 Tax=Portunus trituberculatus TaxID=210409 RepID=A0A5B7G8I7_PORTR|nr:hypothetical protein [Portunus trituberculatus]
MKRPSATRKRKKINTRERAVAGTDVAANDVSEVDEPLVAAYRQPTHPAKTAYRRSPSDVPSKTRAMHCSNCGERHGHEKTSCPAYGRKSGACGKQGLFKRMYRSSRTHEASKLGYSITICSTTLSPEPVLQVCVGPLAIKVGIEVTAVADTGAQVCIAGQAMMVLLGLKPAQLQRRAGIRDLAKIPLTSLAAATCRIGLHGRSTVQDVYFESVERRFTKRPVPWWNAAYTKAVKEKRAAFSRLRRHRGDPQCLDAFRRCRARARRVLKEAQRASRKAYVSSINARTPLTDVFNKVRELLGSILLLPHQFCCLLGERWQTLGLSPTSSQSILQPRANVTAIEWNLLA